MTPEPNPNPPAPPPTSFSIKNVFAMSAIAALIAGGIYAYFAYTVVPENMGGIDGLIGMTERVKADPSTLVEGFTDEDGDGIADPPKDPAKLVNPEKLILAGIANPRAPDQVDSLKPLADHIAKVTGKPVEIEVITDAIQAMEFFKAGKVHITVFNTGLVPAAVNAAGFVPYVAPATEDGKYTYSMVFVAPADSPIDSLEKLKGKHLAVVGITSHSGYKMPLVFLKQEKGLVAGRDYDIFISGGHEQTIQTVLKKVYDAGVVASEMLDRAVGEGKLKEGELREVYRSEPANPAAPWGYAYNIDPALATKIREAFDTFAWDGTAFAEAYKGTNLVKFAKVNYKQDWEPIRKVTEAMRDWNKK